MSVNLLEFKPQLLWHHFDVLRRIPRGSGNETAAGDYVVSVAKNNHLDYSRDEVGNVVVRVPAIPGHEQAATVILQGHLDMVCEKNSDVKFDFLKDEIQLRREGDWFYAQGTTLGADNGIGLAAALAIAEDKTAVHGPLELLFTIDEETGLTGAARLKSNFITGRKYLNLDSEEEGVAFIGCSGGADTRFLLPTQFEKPLTGKVVRIQISGLKGGHSGIDIDKHRGNAIKFMVRLLWQTLDQLNCRIAEIKGGNKRNAIPREIYTDVVVPAENLPELKKNLETAFANLRFEFKTVETEMKLTVKELYITPEKVLNKKTQQMLMNFLLALPHGVLAMSADIPDLVQTSVNLATIQLVSDQIEICLSSRSSIKSALETTRHKLQALGKMVNAKIEQPEGYPGWTPNLDSPILAVVRSIYARVAGKELQVKAIHAGLECGIIGEKFADMDMVSFGPQIEHPHSPDERVLIPSVERFWNLLKAVLVELAG